MPDENCRRCGYILKNYLKCKNCNILLQEICSKCNEKTLPRYHDCSKIILA